MAMKEQCRAAVAKALGKEKLTIQESKDIEARIIQAKQALARKDREGFRNMSEAQRLIEASKLVATEIQADQARKNAITAMDVINLSKNLSELNHPSLPAMEVIDRKIAAFGDMSGIQSVDSKHRAIASLYKGRLVDFYTSVKGATGIFTDKDLVMDIVKARFGEVVDNPLAKRISDEMGKVFEDMRERFNRSGGMIGKLENWALPQTHDGLKLIKAGKDAWINHVMPRIDSKQYVKDNGEYMSHDEIKDMLSYAFDTISMDGANKTEIGKSTPSGIGSKITSRNNESRVLHFKDADSWLEYQAEFGGMQFADLIESHVMALSKDIALVESFGSNPQNTMKILMDAAEKIDKQNGLDPNKARKRATVMFEEFTNGNSVQSELLANMGLAYRSLNVASMLGGTTLSSLTDQAMIKKTANLHGINYRNTFGEMISQLNPRNKEDRRQAHYLGLATEEMLGSIARWADDGLTSTHGKAEKVARVSSGIATQVMRISGLNALTAASKVGFSKMLMTKYGDLSRNTKWDSLNESDRKLMEATGLNKQAWEVMQIAEPITDRRGNQMMTAQSIYAIPDEKLKKFGNPNRIRDDVATRFQAHILDEQGLAVIEAGLRERSFMNIGQKGTIIGEISKSMLQFKSFPAAFLMRQGSRMLAQDGLKGKAQYGMSLFAMTTLLGGLVVQLKELANGNDPQTIWDEDDPKKAGSFFVRSAVQGGGLSILGDILVAGSDTSGRGVDSFVGGPFAQDVKTVAGLTLGNLTQYHEGKETNAANEAFRLLKGKTPAQNLWYTKAATNRLIFDEFQDMLAPNYRERLLRKAEREQDRTRWWGDDITDIQSPDFDKVVE